MKASQLFFLLSIAIIFGVSCSKNENLKSFTDYKEYVNSRFDSADYYFDKSWNELEKEYIRLKAEANIDSSKWSEKTKREYEVILSDWVRFKNMYDFHRRELEREMLMMGLLPKNIHPDFSNVKPEELRPVYDHFVNYVDVNKDTFSREQWNQIDNLWDKLNAKKDLLNDQLSLNDKARIATEKITYTGIKALNRPLKEPAY
jgi:hypothetical protein